MHTHYHNVRRGSRSEIFLLGVQEVQSESVAEYTYVPTVLVIPHILLELATFVMLLVILLSKLDAYR
jgi:hypothetical protein